ncbi:MAG: GAF domain-containing protein [Acidimicrobiales bacterium]
MTDERRDRILADLDAADGRHSASQLCQASSEVLHVSGAGVMILADDLPMGSLCNADGVSAELEELQYTLGEGPCLDAYRLGEVVLEPDLDAPTTPRWMAFTPLALQAGARAVFGFPLGVGGARLGALNLYQDRAGSLSDDQHADALILTDVIAHWVLETQGSAPTGDLADSLELGSNFHFIVHNAAGAVSVQLGVTVNEALIRLRGHAFSNDLPLNVVAQQVVDRKLRFS